MMSRVAVVGLLNGRPDVVTQNEGDRTRPQQNGAFRLFWCVKRRAEYPLFGGFDYTGDRLFVVLVLCGVESRGRLIFGLGGQL